MSETKEESNSTSSDVKDEEEGSPKTEEAKTDESSKDSDKDSKESVKNDTKKETKKEVKKAAASAAKNDSEKEDSEEESEDEEGMGLLDRPVEVSGCRARKKVERLEIGFTPKERNQTIEEGRGKKLGECPRIENQIQKISNNDLKPLHKILFRRVGGATEVKRNIRKFSGFTFTKNSPDYNKKKIQIEKLTHPILKRICAVLDIERGGQKADIVARVLEFLMEPKDSGMKVPKKKNSSKDTKKTGQKAKNSKPKKGKEASSDDNSEMDVDVENQSVSDKNSDKEDDEDEKDSDGESDLEPPKKKTKPAKPTKKAPPKKADKKEKPKKEEKKGSTKGSKRKRDEDSDEDSGEESAPATKKKGPSDEEIKKLVKTILKDANLQEITMKKVIKQVAEAYPAVDLSSKKAFIKATIKSCIS